MKVGEHKSLTCLHQLRTTTHTLQSSKLHGTVHTDSSTNDGYNNTKKRKLCFFYTWAMEKGSVFFEVYIHVCVQEILEQYVKEILERPSLTCARADSFLLF